MRKNLIDAASVRDPTRRQPAPTIPLMEAKRVCMMPQDPGACLASEHSFAFNMEKLMCVPFLYGGCGGNENRFPSEGACLRKCKPLQDMLRGAIEEDNQLPVVASGDLVVSPRGGGGSGKSLEERKRICMMQNDDAGSCYASIQRFGFHAMKGMCVPFYYGGCGGNENNFVTEAECLDVCGPLRDMIGGGGGGASDVDIEADRLLADSKRVCMQPQKTGRCRANMPRFAFNVEKQMCVPFTYGGCGANDNNFGTEMECQKVCLPFQKMLMNAGGGGGRVAPPPRRRGKKPRKNKDQFFGASGSQSHVNRISPGAPCCACGNAKYKIVFKGIWSPESHPKDFPKQLFLTHWSDLIGGSHSRRFRLIEICPC